VKSLRAFTPLILSVRHSRISDVKPGEKYE